MKNLMKSHLSLTLKRKLMLFSPSSPTAHKSDRLQIKNRQTSKLGVNQRAMERT